METFLSILFIMGAAFIGIGVFLVHLNKASGAGLITFGIILLGISTGIIRIGA